MLSQNEWWNTYIPRGSVDHEYVDSIVLPSLPLAVVVVRNARSAQHAEQEPHCTRQDRVEAEGEHAK